MKKSLKILLIDSSYPINTRNSKILNSLSQIPNFDLNVIAWNRDGRSENEWLPNAFIYNGLAPYGKKIKKISQLFKFKKFIKNVIGKLNPDVIIASHWDVLALVSCLKPQTSILIYENLDIPTSENYFILKFIQYLENKALKNTNIIIHASRFFKALYQQHDIKQFILENKPDNSVFDEVNTKLVKDDKYELIVSFIGNIRYLEIQRNLIDAVSMLENVKLNFYGEGMDLEYLKSYTNSSNIFFLGRYEYKNITQYYTTSDLVWAVYPNKDYNVRYAISNKFHESLYFRIPCVFADKTLLGEFVVSNELGYTVDPYSIDSILELLTKILENKFCLAERKEAIQSFVNNVSSWDEDINNIIEYINEE